MSRLIDDRYTPELLDDLPVKNGFRLRGLDVTRLETFVDAAFAFAITLLVISIDNIPDSYDELVQAFKGVPAFALSFAQIMMFWAGHRAWSRRYGLEDSGAIVLSLLLVFVVLVFVFPLKALFESMMRWLSNDYLNTGFLPTSYADVRGLFVIYGAAFCVLSGILALLFQYAHWRRQKLLLDELETKSTRHESVTWLILSVTGLTSTVLALTLPDRLVALAGFVYFHLAVTMPIFGYRTGATIARMKLALERDGGRIR